MFTKQALVWSGILLMLLLLSCNKEDSTKPVNLDMQEAINKLTKEILPEQVSKNADYFCLRMDSVIQKGMVIEEAIPKQDLRKGDDESAATIVLDEDSYLFYLDLEPGAMFAHDLKYIIVGKSGKSKVVAAQWWPLVNGAIVPEFQKQVPEPKHVVAGTAVFAKPIGKRYLYRFPGQLVLRNNEGFIVVEGLMPDENLYDCVVDTYLNLLDLFLEYKNNCSGDVEVEGLVEGQADNVLTEIDNQVAAGRNPITILITAHGNTNYVRLGGVAMYASQFQAKMAAYPSTRFNFILCSCHSGSFMDEITTLANVYTAHTASQADESAWPDWDSACGLTDHNSSDTGAEWMSSLCEAASAIAGDATHWTSIKTMASTSKVPVASMWMYHACLGGIGLTSSMGLSQDLDLAHRCNSENPMSYKNW